MLIGVPREIKNHEYRVGLNPESVRELVGHGHGVLVESGAGRGSGMPDTNFADAGAEMASSADEIFERADMLVKVKEPQAVERARLRPGQILFTYLHLAPDPDQTHDLVNSGITAIAYETVTDRNNALPLLAPMSEVAGRLSVQAGAHCLEKAQGGAGVLLGGIPGVSPAKILILGGGVVGEHAAQIAIGLGADVTVIDRSLDRLRELSARYGGRIKCVYSTQGRVEKAALEADLIIGAVLIPGGTAPKLISAQTLKEMKNGSVIVDVSIDQGGCFETSRPTTHQEPTYIVDGVVHYCVANMPGAVPRTSTYGLNNATLSYITALADKGLVQALSDDKGFAEGLNIHEGKVTHEAVAMALDYPYCPVVDALIP